MNMLFPVASRREGAKYVEGEWAPEGDLVVPNFPCGRPNTFVGVESHLPSELARVRRLDIDPDVVLARLMAYYTGIPKRVLEAYVLQTAVGVSGLPEDALIRIYIDEHSARVMESRGGGNTVVLWE